MRGAHTADESVEHDGFLRPTDPPHFIAAVRTLRSHINTRALTRTDLRAAFRRFFDARHPASESESESDSESGSGSGGSSGTSDGDEAKRGGDETKHGDEARRARHNRRRIDRGSAGGGNGGNGGVPETAPTGALRVRVEQFAARLPRLASRDFGSRKRGRGGLSSSERKALRALRPEQRLALARAIAAAGGSGGGDYGHVEGEVRGGTRLRWVDLRAVEAFVAAKGAWAARQRCDRFTRPGVDGPEFVRVVAALRGALVAEAAGGLDTGDALEPGAADVGASHRRLRRRAQRVWERCEVQLLAEAIGNARAGAGGAGGAGGGDETMVNCGAFESFVARPDWVRFDFDPYLVRGDRPALTAMVDALRAQALRRAELAGPFHFLAAQEARAARRRGARGARADSIGMAGLLQGLARMGVLGRVARALQRHTKRGLEHAIDTRSRRHHDHRHRTGQDRAGKKAAAAAVASAVRVVEAGTGEGRRSQRAGELLVRPLRQVLERIDTDGDGTLSAGEFAAFIHGGEVGSAGTAPKLRRS
eukprot:g1964.t1